MQRACSALVIVTQERNVLSHEAAEALLSLVGSTELGADDSLDIIESMWEGKSDMCFWRRDFCPATGRRKRFFANSSFYRSGGMTPEEFIARMQHREIAMYQTEYDFLMFICDQIASGLQPATTRIYRHRYKRAHCVFSKTTTHRTFDGVGRLTRMEYIIEPLTLRQLDTELITNPHCVQTTYMGRDPDYSDAGVVCRVYISELERVRNPWQKFVWQGCTFVCASRGVVDTPEKHLSVVCV
jgi:hypothetical protein